MPAYEVECDHDHTVGYVTACGDITADLTVTLPPPEAPRPVVAVLSGAAWSTTPTGDLTLRGRFAAVPPTTGELVGISFVVFAFDPANGVHYRAFESYRGYPASGVGRPGIVYGVLTKATLQEWTISPTRTPQQQQIMLHPTATEKLILPWGQA